MSLVNDALKRARVEALRQEAIRDGLDYRAVPAHSRGEPRSAIHIAGWVVAAVALSAVAWLVLRSPTSVGRRLQSPLPVVSSPSSSEALEVLETPNAVETPNPTDAEVSPDRAPRIEPERRTQAGPPAPTPELESPARMFPTKRSDGDQSPPPSRVSPGVSIIRQAPSARLQDGATYLRRATSADGSIIELSGIAYSEDRPIAVINGSVVSPGDMIAGYTIVAIESGRVELEADGARLYLSLH